MRRTRMAFALVALLSAQASLADVCDYTPSNIVGQNFATATGVAGGTAAAAGIGMKAAGIYTITHATSGAVMLGSTMAGTSAAGTAGIIAGTAGVWGTLGAAVMSPFLIIPAAITAVSIGVYEGACYFSADSDAEE